MNLEKPPKMESKKEEEMEKNAKKIMEDEPELSELSEKREKMLAALEKMGKTGFLNIKSYGGDYGEKFERIVEGNINGHEIEISLNYKKLKLDGKDVSELYDEFYSKYVDVAYDLNTEENVLRERSNRIDDEKRLKDAKEILF